jgi:threonine/homoserine/homoserine lactone efflux protein
MNTLCMGVLLGLSIAVPPGPNAAICMSRTLAAGRKVGFFCGLGVATAHAIYTSLAVVGADRASGLLDRRTFALHIVGGVLLVALGLRMARTGPLPTSVSATRPYVTTLAIGLGNPLTILYLAGAMASGAIPADTGPLVVVGVFAGSAAWWGALTSVTAAVHRYFNEGRLRCVNRLTASAIGGFGVMTVAAAL